jgi:OmpA-like transmembrane domain
MKFVYQIAGLCALAGLAADASAQGWIAGGAVGQAKQQDYDVGGPIATTDDTDDTLRVFGGYLLSPMQGVVVSFIDLGTAYYDGPAWGGFTDYLDAEGYDISYVIGWAPGSQSRVSLFGTVGVFAWDQDVFYTDASGPYLYQDDGTSFSMGIGTEIKLGSAAGSAWGIHFEWQLFKDVGDKNNSGHEYDREALSVGVDYHFGRE